jgi:hypothetical protein
MEYRVTRMNMKSYRADLRVKHSLESGDAVQEL